MDKRNRHTRIDAVEESSGLGRASTLVDHLTNSDLGPFVLVFGLFIAALVICMAGIVFVVLPGPFSLALLLLVAIVLVAIQVSERWASRKRRHASRDEILDKPEKWVIVLGWCLPRKDREVILGDILEDCHGMRQAGFANRRIRTHVLWQWAISVLMLIQGCVVRAIGRLLGAK